MSTGWRYISMSLNSRPLRRRCWVDPIRRLPLVSLRHGDSLLHLDLYYPGGGLLGPNLGQDLGIPPLAHVLMAFDSIEQRGLAQMIEFALQERELHVIDSAARSVKLPQPVVPHREDRGWNVDALEGSVVADALEEWQAEPGAGAGAWAEHTVRRASADTMRERFETLANGDNKRARDGRTIDPGTR